MYLRWITPNVMSFVMSYFILIRFFIIYAFSESPLALVSSLTSSDQDRSCSHPDVILLDTFWTGMNIKSQSINNTCPARLCRYYFSTTHL